jgi:Domain of unknown function (DUF4272)
MDAHATPAAIERKARSEARLASEGVPFISHLPVIEDIANVNQRSKDEIAWRAMALLVVAVKGEGLEHERVLEIVDEYGLQPHLTKKEAAFIYDPLPTEHDRIQFVWRYEAAWVLLWSLGYVDELPIPAGICDVPRAVGFMRDRTPSEFIRDARLRPLDKILDEADLIYRYHWAVVDSRVNDKAVPASLNPSVTLERHYALNWLIGYMGQDWDDVSTDT